MWGATSAKKLADAAQANNEELVTRVVANMVQRTTSLARELLELLEEDLKHPLLKSSLGSRAAFREAQILGSTVHLVPRAATAVEEVEAMANEVLGLLGLPLHKGTGDVK